MTDQRRQQCHSVGLHVSASKQGSWVVTPLNRNNAARALVNPLLFQDRAAMGLFGRKKTTVGLDIGSGLVKVAVVDHSKSTPELVRVAITPLPDDAIVEGEVMDPHLVSDVIRTTIESVDANTKAVVAAVGGRDVIIKRIKTERVKEQQARELMRWEAEQHVTDVDSVELDYQILDENGNASRDEMSVLLVAAKRDLV